MEPKELIERYLYAVTRRLSPRLRRDVEEELRGLIEDMLEEEGGDSLAHTEAVLTRLGSPDLLAQRYSPNQDRYLIGPAYFDPYCWVLGVVCASVVLGMGVSWIVCALVNPGELWAVEPLQWLGGILAALSMAFAFVTGIFFLFQRWGVKLRGKRDLRSLPPVPVRQEVIPRREAVLGLIMPVVFGVMLLAVPVAITIQTGGGAIPFFSEAGVRRSVLPILLFCALGMARESFKLYEGRYTWRLAAVTAGADLLSAGAACAFLLGSGGVINPRAAAELARTASAAGDGPLAVIFGQFHLFFLGCILFALAVDLINTLARTARARK